MAMASLRRNVSPVQRSDLSSETAPQTRTYRTPDRPFRMISREVGQGCWRTTVTLPRSANVVFVCVADGGGPVPGPGLGEDPVDVGLDRVVAEEQLRGDLGVGHPAGDEPEDLDLALG